MNSQKRIRDALDRVQHVIDKRPEAARVTPVMRALIVDGTRCESGVKPDPSAVRHTLYLDCDGPREALQAIIDKSQRQSVYLEVFAKPQAITGQVVFSSRPQD